MIGYSPKFPLQVDDQVGAYALNTTLRGVVKQNFINLMLTVPGERVMDINFGVGLRKYLFEQNTPFLTSQIALDIKQQTEKYLPFISIDFIDFNKSHLLDGHKDQILEVLIEYSVPSLETTGDIQWAESISIGTLQESL